MPKTVISPKYLYRTSSPRRSNRRFPSVQFNVGKDTIIRSGIILTATIVICASIWVLYQFSQITSLSCSTQYGDCIPEINNTLEAYQGQTAPLAIWHVRHTLPTLFAQVRNVQTNISLDRNLDVTLEVDTPALTVTTPRLREQNQFFPVSFNGVVLGSSNQETPPSLTVEQLSAIPGGHLSSQQIAAVQMVYHIATLGYTFQALMSDDHTLQLAINANAKLTSVLLPLDSQEPPSHFVNTLQVILRQSTIAKDSVQIDLRFAKPIVRPFEPSVAGASTKASPSGQPEKQ